MELNRIPSWRLLRRRGFSLTEMLVVTAIVSITAAATMPAIMSFRARGRGVLCQNNLRNLVIAFNLYMHSNKGHVPAAALEPARNASHNLAGYYITPGGFRPQGLGRLIAARCLDQPEMLYCPSDTILFPENAITGLEAPFEGWVLRYPLLTSYIVRPFGNAVPMEETSALKHPFSSNPSSSVFLAESSNNHEGGVYVAHVNSAVTFVKNVPIPVQASTATGIKGMMGPVRGGIVMIGLQAAREGAYLFQFYYAPWIWLALDHPEQAEDLIRRGYPPVR
jgi:prepilin-type N-terminal cleavage/methylation domain-containing protein